MEKVIRKLSKVGNSYGVTLPPNWVRRIPKRANEDVELELIWGEVFGTSFLVITPKISHKSTKTKIDKLTKFLEVV